MSRLASFIATSFRSPGKFCARSNGSGREAGPGLGRKGRARADPADGRRSLLRASFRGTGTLGAWRGYENKRVPGEPGTRHVGPEGWGPSGRPGDVAGEPAALGALEGDVRTRRR